ncbi:unnamed protein product [Litomosoides sigmodontis]|uniref:Uncharacterized protein n=1 Tax=Litomosoides sigmodontis TaxID=42156 RepID=A0A3P7K5U2_LITSI|nr:unnamed protein product [Litomosoides sigmodontis]
MFTCATISLYHCNLGEVRNNLNWRVFHTTPLPIVRGWESYFSLCYTSDGEHVIVGGSGGYFCAHRSDVKAIHCSKADRHFFCTGSTDGSCKLWDDRALYNNIPVAVCTGDGYSISHIDGDSYDRYICATTVGGAITIWDSRRFSQNSLFNVQQEEAIQRGGAYSNIALKMEGQNTLEIFWRAKFSPEGTGHRYIYCGSGSGHVYIFDIMTGEVIRLFRKCKAEVQDCSWNPNDNEVISVALCGSTSRWYCKEEGSDGLMSEVCYH